MHPKNLTKKTPVNGFTLIELLIALFVFMTLSMIAGAALYNTFQTKQHLEIHQAKLATLQLATALLRQDISQMIDRPPTIAGAPLPSFVGSATSLQFTRDGLINPEERYFRSHLQRVAYSLQEGRLIRQTFNLLDGSTAVQPSTSKTLLANLTQVNFTYLDKENKRRKNWQAQTDASGTDETLPSAILVELVWPKQEKITLTFKITASSLSAAKK